jgi:hypothetical protein
MMELAEILKEWDRHPLVADDAVDQDVESEFYGPDDPNLPANAHYHPGRGWHIHDDECA